VQLRVMVVGAAVVALLCVGAVWFLVSGRSSAEIETVADRFEPPAGWSLDEEIVRPPRVLCLDDVCPRVYRRYSSEIGLTADELAEAASAVGGQWTFEGTCTPNSGVQGTDPLCSGSGSVDGYRVELTQQAEGGDVVSGLQADPTYRLTLVVTEG
jgi:hypothetical protein